MSVSPEQETSFGDRLRRLRDAAGLTQEELAFRAGLSPNAISDLERGRRRRPYPHTVRALSETLGLPEDERASLLASVPRRRAAAVLPATALSSALPAPPTPLVGREKDTQTLRSLFERDGARLITLMGPGGVGKTRLALEAARASAEHFPDGVAFVALAPISDPTLLVSTVAHALGLRETGGRPARDQLHAYLRNKRMLLVLDNLEHLLGAAPEVATLLAACPSLKVLATSRAPLRLRGEREYPVEPLAVPEPARVPDTGGVFVAAAARLFVERAGEADPAFSLTERNAGAVAAICWRLDGLPLALELAAVSIRFLGATELLSRLDQALQAGGARDLPERQRTMRATLDWSHDLLGESEQALFQRLSVFAGGFTLEAAEAVGATGEAGTGDVLGLLGTLVEQSLVRVKPAGHEGEVRYGMLEPVRQYALEKLEGSGEEERARARHAAYFGALAARAGPELKRSDQASWLGRLDREHDNLRAALGWLLARGEAGQVAGIGWAIHRFWSLRGHTAEGRRWMDRALSTDDALPADVRARALYVVGMLSFVRGEQGRTVEATEECIAAARAADDRGTLAVALLGRGLTALGGGDLDAAEGILLEALAMSREQDDPSSIALGLDSLAQVALARGEFDRVEGLLAEAEALSRAAGDWFTLAADLSSQALAARLRGDEARTASLLQESVGIAATLRDAWHVVYGVTGLAGVAAHRGRAERAARLFGAVEALCERMGVTVPSPAWRELNERGLENAREQLDPEMFDAAWAEGRKMPFEDMVAEALEDNE